MKKFLSFISFSLLLSFFSLSAYSVQEEKYQAYREYFPLAKKVEDAPRIVIFFSFASRESYELIHPNKKGLLRLLRHIELVPVDFYSPFDNFLAEKWCLEDFLSDALNDRWDVSKEQYFNDVFFWMERFKSTGRYIRDGYEIQGIVRSSRFSRGIDRYKYTDFYTDINNRCNFRRKELINSFKVTSVPSVYVNGKYLINEAVMSTRGGVNESSQRTYLPLIDYLLYKKDD